MRGILVGDVEHAGQAVAEFVHRGADDEAVVAVLTDGVGDAGEGEGPHLVGVEQEVVVVVAALEDREADLGVHHAGMHVAEGQVAGVADDVGPGDGLADRDGGTGGRVGVAPIGGFFDVDAGIDAEVVRGVVVRHGAEPVDGIAALGDRDAGDVRHVLVLADGDGAGEAEVPDLVHIEQTVVVEVAREVGGRALAVVDDAGLDSAQGDAAEVADLVDPGDRIPDREQRAGGEVGVLAVGELLDVDAGLHAQVVRGVGVGDVVHTGQAVAEFVHRGADHVGVVGVEAGGGGHALDLEGPDLVGVEQLVAVGVAPRVGGGALAGIDHPADHPAQRQFAGVADEVGPEDGLADRDEGTVRSIRVLAVGELLDVDAGVDPEVVRGVLVLDRRQPVDRVAVVIDWNPDHVRIVGVLTGRHGAAGGEDPDLVHVEQVVGVQVAGTEAHAALDAVDHRGHDPGQRHRAAVGDLVGPGHGLAVGEERPGRVVGVLAVGVLLDVDAGLDPGVVGGIEVGHIDHARQAVAEFVHRGADDDSVVAVEPHGVGGAHELEGPDFVGVEEEVAVGVAVEVGGHALEVVVDAAVHIGQRQVAGVAHDIGPHDRVAHRDEGAVRRVGVLTVGGLLDVDAGADAEVVRGVFVGHRIEPVDRRAGVVDRLAGDLRQVGVLAGGDRAGELEDPDFSDVEQVVVVEVAGLVGGRAFHVVDHAGLDPREGDGTSVGHGVGPGDRVADREGGAGGIVGVLAVGGLLDVDAGVDAGVVGGIAVADFVETHYRVRR